MAEAASIRPAAVDMALVAEDEPHLEIPKNTLLRRERPHEPHPRGPHRRAAPPSVRRETQSLTLHPSTPLPFPQASTRAPARLETSRSNRTSCTSAASRLARCTPAGSRSQTPDASRRGCRSSSPPRSTSRCVGKGKGRSHPACPTPSASISAPTTCGTTTTACAYARVGTRTPSSRCTRIRHPTRPSFPNTSTSDSARWAARRPRR